MKEGRLGLAWLIGLCALGASSLACSEDSSSSPSTGGAGGAGGMGGAAGSGGTVATGGAAGGGGSGGAAGAPSCEGTPIPSNDPKLAAVIAALKAQLDPVKVPGGAVAIVVDGKLAHVVVAGSKVSGSCDPISADTLFRVGHITQVVTTMAALELAEQKKLSLSAPITDALPSFAVAAGKAVASDVTLGHLLTHSSGYAPGAVNALPCASLADSVAAANVPLWCQPGTMDVWDPANFSLAGLAVEAAAKKPFAAAARELVLDPLKMGGTFEPTEAVKLDHALGHQDSGFEQQLTGVDCGHLHPSTQYHASIQDVGKLAAALLSGGGGVLDPASVDDLFASHGPSFMSAHYRSYAFLRNAPLDAAFTGGRAAAFRQDMLLFPKQKLGIITLLNGTSGEAEAVSDAAAAQYSTIPISWPQKSYTAAAADLQSLVGKYEDNLGYKGVSKRTLEVSYDGTSLQAKLVEATQTGQLAPIWSKDNFEVALGSVTHELRFWRDTGGAPLAVSFADGGPPFYFVAP